MKLIPLLLALLACLGGWHANSPSTHSTSYHVVHGWPQLPEGFALGQVAGVGVDSHNHVFVFHRGDQPILCFDGKSGRLIKGWGDGLFAKAHGLAVDSEDNIWVTDTGDLEGDEFDTKHPGLGHVVMKFSHEGKLLMTIGTPGVPGEDATHFNGPADIAIDRNGDFYVADGYGNKRVVKMSKEGKFLFAWGEKGDKPGQFNEPHSIALDSEGRVYVADRENSRIQVFTGEGKYLYQWKSNELGRPWALRVGPDNYLYVVDGGDFKPKPPDRGRALKLDLTGRILESWGSFGSYDGQFYWAHDVAVGKDGAVYIGDVSVGMRVQKFVQD